MPAADAAWLHMDRPTNPMVVNGLIQLGATPTVEAVAEIVERRLTALWRRKHDLGARIFENIKRRRQLFEPETRFAAGIAKLVVGGNDHQDLHEYSFQQCLTQRMPITKSGLSRGPRSMMPLRLIGIQL